ncbi:hypothetical protein J4411_00875 [Candidatus Pacearchaeota archaeon]|nr:hypothetical protein [uncultured archaeon]MBS3084448.1 hypothetical protein [Candidatus Pacearchaeota archaeon]
MLSKGNLPLKKRVDLNPNEKRLWNTLVRIDSLDCLSNKIGFLIPGWNTEEVLYFDTEKIPELLLKEIEKGMNPNYRFFAPVNIGADKSEDLYIDIKNYKI